MRDDKTYETLKAAKQSVDETLKVRNDCHEMRKRRNARRKEELQYTVDCLYRFEQPHIAGHLEKDDKDLCVMFGYGLTQEQARTLARGILFAIHNLEF